MPVSKSEPWDNESVVEMMSLLVVARHDEVHAVSALAMHMTLEEKRTFCVMVNHNMLITDAELIPVPLDEVVKLIEGNDEHCTEARRRLAMTPAEGHIRYVIVGTRMCWADLPVTEEAQQANHARLDTFDPNTLQHDGTAWRRFGATVVQRDNGKFAALMVYTDTGEFCAPPFGEFDTIEDAQKAGSAAITKTIETLKSQGINAFRPEKA